MSEAIEGLKPERFWRCFAEISRIPRPSGHEERIGQFILERAQTLGLAARKDSCGNIVVKKPASPGLERRRSICLQSHLDMVCEKNADKVHDFHKDPIELVRKGEVITANGTTLGADNGVGVATSLAIMEDPSLEHGPLELLFTVEEETGLAGAKNLAPDLVESRTLLNLDSEDEGILYIGCAGGKDTAGNWKRVTEAAPADAVAATLTVKGLKGGHSGLEIDKGLGNAIKMANRCLVRLTETGARVSTINGGNMRNAIPRECSALLFIPEANLARAEALVARLRSDFRAELAKVDPNLDLLLTRESRANKGVVLEQSLQKRLMQAISAMPSGVIHMSADIPGLVETSTNLAVITTTKAEISVVTSQRSSVATRLMEAAETAQDVLELGGAQVAQSEGYPGWKPNLDSDILKTAKECYRSLYGKDVEVTAIHAGLECGIIGERIPGMDMISFGPDMEMVHSPDERVYVESVSRYWDFLLAMLKAAQ